MRNTMIFALAAVFAAVIAFVVSGKFAPQPEQNQGDTVKILVAKADISAGTFVNPELHLGWSDIKKEQIQSGYILEGSANIQKFSGAVARLKINAGEPITPEQLVKTDDGGFMAAVLTPGMRAVTVAVTPVTGVAGFVFPGDKVDVVLTKRSLAAGGRDFSDKIVRAARVLAIDQKYAAATTQIELAKTVTLEVKPEDVDVITYGADAGKLSLALVSSIKPKDIEPSAEQQLHDEASAEEEGAEGAKEKAPKEANDNQRSTAKPFVMQLVKGNELISREFSLKKQ